VAILAMLAWTSPIQLRADTTTQKKTVKTGKPKSRTAPHHGTHKASAVASKHSSTHHSPKRHVSSRAAQIAAAKRRRAHLRPEPERVEEIQQALAKTGYLKTQPNGLWDDETRDAMRRYQADHGFPVTGLPEAKSLMKLGLGPHPLPADLDSSGGASNDAKATVETDGSTPVPPTTSDTPAPEPNPPTTTTPPKQ
jgi:hypothetical protein